ncbi:hypothetical protein PPYR_05539 [Photinus pyralis]|uniref:Uncharacterized protein n=1 Tax=Photinus pyralis TaxID=7054 RepID=A0A1Y1LB85_PHOPY|nr:hypothetical protein PPYR_05539 [Photinus pyralis]
MTRSSQTTNIKAINKSVTCASSLEKLASIENKQSKKVGAKFSTRAVVREEAAPQPLKGIVKEDIKRTVKTTVPKQSSAIKRRLVVLGDSQVRGWLDILTSLLDLSKYNITVDFKPNAMLDEAPITQSRA